MKIMQLKQLFTDDRAVSPVIGVILMVAITVILAAVIGTFVLGLGDSLQQQSPSASFGFDYDNNADTENATVVITHEGGDSIDAELLTVSVGGATVGDTADYAYVTQWSNSVSAGSSTTVEKNQSATTASWAGETVRVVWTSNDGSSSQTIASRDAPN